MTTPPEGADTEAARIKSIDEKIAAGLASMKDEVLGAVRDMIGTVKGAEGKAQGAAQAHEEDKLNRPSDAAASLGDMVNAAVDKVLGDRQRADQEEAHRKAHEALEQAGAERTPVERSRRHRVMGWGDPAE